MSGAAQGRSRTLRATTRRRTIGVGAGLSFFACLWAGCAGTDGAPTPAPEPRVTPVVEHVADDDVATILRLATRLGLHGVARIEGLGTGECNVWEFEQRVDALTTKKRVVSMKRLDASELSQPARAGAVREDAWEASPDGINASVTAHVPIDAGTVDVQLQGTHPIDSAEAVRIVSALASGAVTSPQDLPPIDVRRIVGMQRPPDVAVEVARYSRTMTRWDDSVVEVIITDDRKQGLSLCLSVGATRIVCVGEATFSSSH